MRFLRLFSTPIATWHPEARAVNTLLASSTSTAGDHQLVTLPLATLATLSLDSISDEFLIQF